MLLWPPDWKCLSFASSFQLLLKVANYKISPALTTTIRIRRTYVRYMYSSMWTRQQALYLRMSTCVCSLASSLAQLTRSGQKMSFNSCHSFYYNSTYRSSCYAEYTGANLWYVYTADIRGWQIEAKFCNPWSNLSLLGIMRTHSHALLISALQTGKWLLLLSIFKILSFTLLNQDKFEKLLLKHDKYPETKSFAGLGAQFCPKWPLNYLS